MIGGHFALFDGTILVLSHNPAFVEQIDISRMLNTPEEKKRRWAAWKIESARR